MKPTTLLVSLSKVDGFIILALNIVLDLRSTTFSSIYTATNATNCVCTATICLYCCLIVLISHIDSCYILGMNQ